MSDAGQIEELRALMRRVTIDNTPVVLDFTEREYAAWHEAAVAVMAREVGWRVTFASIISTDVQRRFTYTRHRALAERTKDRALVKILLGPLLVLERLNGTLVDILFTDWAEIGMEEHGEQILAIAKRNEQPGRSWVKYLESAVIQVRWTLDKPARWRSIERIAAALLERETLTGGEIQALAGARFRRKESQ